MVSPFPAAPANLPFISAEQMREVDRLMVDGYGVSLLQMMENAGRNLAKIARLWFFSGDSNGARVLVLAGPGGNGGGGLAAARHLHNAGAAVEILLPIPANRLSDAAAAQLETLVASGVRVTQYRGRPLPDTDLIIDAIIGYGLQGDPIDPIASLIDAATNSPAPVLANDIPSGIDATSGSVARPAVHADVTLTIALPKEGLRSLEARLLGGHLFVGDISVPARTLRAQLPFHWTGGTVR